MESCLAGCLPCGLSFSRGMETFKKLCVTATSNVLGTFWICVAYFPGSSHESGYVSLLIFSCNRRSIFSNFHLFITRRVFASASDGYFGRFYKFHGNNYNTLAIKHTTIRPTYLWPFAGASYHTITWVRLKIRSLPPNPIIILPCNMAITGGIHHFQTHPYHIPPGKQT